MEDAMSKTRIIKTQKRKTQNVRREKENGELGKDERRGGSKI